MSIVVFYLSECITEEIRVDHCCKGSNYIAELSMRDSPPFDKLWSCYILPFSGHLSVS